MPRAVRRATPPFVANQNADAPSGPVTSTVAKTWLLGRPFLPSKATHFPGLSAASPPPPVAIQIAPAAGPVLGEARA